MFVHVYIVLFRYWFQVEDFDSGRQEDTAADLVGTHVWEQGLMWLKSTSSILIMPQGYRWPGKIWDSYCAVLPEGTSTN